MDEQTPIPQIETLPRPQSPPIPPQNTNPQSPSQKSDPSSEPASIPETSQPTAAEIPHNSNNPSKIPIRPQKIRKLSTPTPPSPPQTTTDDTPAASLPLSTIPTPTPHNPKNRRRTTSQASKALPKVIKPLTADGEVESALRHLRAADPLLAPLMDTHPSPHFEAHLPPFIALAKSIIYQQLAYKAGTAIYTRFIALCGGEDSMSPDSVLALSSQQLKQIGVSGRKASYLYDLANKYKSGILSDDTVVKMDDRSLFTLLSLVKGIGSWSVHMFMIFSLYRPDVLPVSDLGVRKGVQLLYGLEELPRPSHIEQLCEKWRPYRSVGAWYMWRLIEGKGAMPGGSREGSVVQPLQQVDPLQDGLQHQHQLQFVEPVNGIGNIGACIWNQ